MKKNGFSNVCVAETLQTSKWGNKGEISNAYRNRRLVK